MIDQPASQASASHNRMDAYLLYMGTAIEHIDDHEPHRVVGVVHTNPGLSNTLVFGQVPYGWWRVVGNVGHTDAPKRFSCGQLEIR
ncbi:hypothetical protein OG229_34220 [Streptomyces platensis]|uniref:hypothetical protein n=1 Tax=Streptomyces platensis TaxID=58346 RepID=UPI002E0EAB9D|nr:hypothetical protein OG229_34220 [Streptomyces platensis]